LFENMRINPIRVFLSIASMTLCRSSAPAIVLYSDIMGYHQQTDTRGATEVTAAMKRAGADLIIAYYAEQRVNWM